MIRPLYPIPIATRPPRPPARRLDLNVQLSRPSRDPASLTVGQFLSPLRRSWRLVALFAILGLAAALFLASCEKPVYRSTALLEVAGNNQEAGATDRAVESNLQTQVRILQSPELLRRVAGKLDLWSRPEFQRSRGWSFAALARSGGERTRAEVLRQLARSLVARVSGQTNIIEVQAESIDPQLAGNLANTASRELIELSLARRAKSAAETKRWLSGQLKEGKATLERSEQALRDYVNESGLLDPGTDSVEEASLKQLREALSKARQDRVVEQGRYERAMSSPPEALPEVLDDITLSNYETKLTDLKRQLAELSANLEPGHSKVKEMQAQIGTVQVASDRRRTNILNRINNQYESALQLERREIVAYERQIGRVAAQAANIQLFEEAEIPQIPSKPILPLHGAIGLGIGILAGLVIAFGMSRRGETIRTSDDLRNSLGLPELGVIPAVRERLGVLLSLRKRLGMDVNGVDHWGNRIELASCPPGDAPPSDSIRAIVASILYSNADGPPPRVIAVTSVSEGEGKTTAATNIAAILAQTNHRVLLVDGHFRRPRLHNIFNLRIDGGLIQALNDFMATGAGVLNFINCQPTAVRGLFVMSAGSRSASRMNQLYSQSLPEIVAAMRGQFDAVVIDSAPLSDLESRPIARVADGVLLVVQAGRTTVEDLREAALRLHRDGAVVLGTVLNHSDGKKTRTVPVQD